MVAISYLHHFQLSTFFFPSYGAHLTAEQVNDLITPHSDSISLVDSWLGHHGINCSTISRSAAGDWATVTVSVEQAEAMMGTKYGVYHHPSTGETVVRTMSYSIPSVLIGHVDVISPTTYFSTTRSMRSTAFLQPHIQPISDTTTGSIPKLITGAVPSSCNTKITPACLRTLYSTTSYTPSATSSNKLGVVGYLKEYANRADLQTFFKKFRTDAVGGTYSTELVNGGLDDQSKPGTEANLDIQYTEGMSYPTPNIYYSTGGSPPYNPDSQTTTG